MAHDQFCILIYVGAWGLLLHTLWQMLRVAYPIPVSLFFLTTLYPWFYSRWQRAQLKAYLSQLSLWPRVANGNQSASHWVGLPGKTLLRGTIQLEEASSLPYCLPAWHTNVMSGASAAILDHEMALRMKAMN